MLRYKNLFLNIIGMLLLVTVVSCSDANDTQHRDTQQGDRKSKPPASSQMVAAPKYQTPNKVYTTRQSPSAENANDAPRLTSAEVLNAVRVKLEGLEKGLDGKNQSEEELVEMRERLGAAAGQIRTVLAELSPRANAISAQLAQMGPKPADNTPPESETVAKEREERSRALAELQAKIGLAEALQVQAGQISTLINDQRRVLLAHTLFAHGRSILSPSLWRDAIASIPEGLETGRKIFGGWLEAASHRSPSGMVITTFIAITIAAGLYFLEARFLPQLSRRSPNEVNPDRLRRVLKAVGVMCVVSIPIIAAMLTVFIGLDAEGLAEGRMETVIVWVLLSASFFVFMRALAGAILSPGLPQWRLFSMEEETAVWLYHASIVLTVVMLAGQVVQVIVAAADANLSLVSLVDGMAAFAVAIVMLWALYGLHRLTKPIEDDFGPYVSSTPQIWNVVRMAAWLATFVVLAALVTGFIAFASFLVDQIVWVSMVVGLFFLVTVLIEEAAVEGPKRNSRVSLVLQTSVGLRRRTLEQIGILFAGITKLIFFAIGIMLVLAPWGLESNDVLSSIKMLRDGITIGEMHLMPLEVLAAILTFMITLFISRMIQKWLSTRFLPATGTDPGIRNSIATGMGYLGFFLAVGLACTQLGLSLDRVAIVAGALSVGIGFGLQSIVNNFVSGLILLWERPIKVGDWVVVGPDEGYVKRINVRATEIETFDRAAVIVPNSSLVSGTVKNWLHHDRLGRLVISIGVSYAADPDDVRELMLACAKAHPQVLENPAPSVLLRNFEPTMLRFEMRCFIPNVENRLLVTSDINFAVLKALREKDIIPVRPMVWEDWRFGAKDKADADEGGYSHHHGQGDAGGQP